MKVKIEGIINLFEIDIIVDENIVKIEKEFLNLM